MNKIRMKYMDNYVQTAKKSLEMITQDNFQNKLFKVIDILINARKHQNTIFILGNGGSASTASHFACDLSKLTIINDDNRFRVIALTDNVPQITAWANDLGYEYIFCEQLKNLLQEKDVVIGISGSGNSMNVINAIKYANNFGASTIGFIGFNGGMLADIVKTSLLIRCNNMQICEDMHLILSHIISSLIKNEIKRDVE